MDGTKTNEHTPPELSQTVYPFEIVKTPKLKFELKNYEEETFDKLDSLEIGQIKPLIFENISKFIKSKSL